MVLGGVVHDQVEDHAHAQRAHVVHEVDEVAQRAVFAVDGVVVRHVVAVVLVGRHVERLQPEAGHSEAGQVLQAAAEALEVADAVAVAVHVRLDVEAIQDGVLVPEVLDGHGAPFAGRVAAGAIPSFVPIGRRPGVCGV
jgi:hypothetical protein